MLDKRLQLGGLQVGGPRTMQNTARFRIANNVYQTRDNYMVPRFPSEAYSSPVSSDKTVGGAMYKRKPFTLGMETSDGRYKPYYETSAVSSSTLPTNPNTTDLAVLSGYGPQYLEKLDCLYINFPFAGLFKYDGYQAYRAGVPLPWGFCSQLDASTPDIYVRTIQHHMDFQGNIVNSGYEEFPAKKVAIGADTGITVRLDGAGGGTFGSNHVEDIASLANGYDSYYFIETSQSADVPAKELTITTGGDHNVVVGIYLITRATKSTGTSLINGSFVYTEAVAFKVKSFTGTTVVLDMSNALALTDAYQWVEVDITVVSLDIYPLAAIGTVNGGCNYWVSVWTSTSSTGNYVIKKVLPVYYESATDTTTSVVVNTATVPDTKYYEGAFNLAGNLGDIYDVLSVKSPFPWFNGLEPKSFTKYADLILIAYKNEIYFPDTTLGGSFEMVNGQSFISVGEGDDGEIQAICGNSNFLFVSRQFKNYYINGNLPTANYRVQEINQTSLGAYSNESAISVGDKIVFLNKHGIWAIYPGGRCEEASENVIGLFNNFSNTTEYTEETYWDIDDYPTYAEKLNTADEWVRVRYDLNRGLVIFLIAGDGTGTALVLNMNNGEFYTWNGLISGLGENPDIKDMFFIDGMYYATSNTDTATSIRIEDKDSGAYPYMELAPYPALLHGTWFTGGEPSLEKKINQIKLWGKIVGSIEMGHSVDMDSSVETPADTYTNADANLYSHKHGLPPANALSVSVYLKLECTKFELEGMELEFQPFQQGMKR